MRRPQQLIVHFQCAVPQTIYSPTTERTGNSRGVGQRAKGIPEGRWGELLNCYQSTNLADLSCRPNNNYYSSTSCRQRYIKNQLFSFSKVLQWKRTNLNQNKNLILLKRRISPKHCVATQLSENSQLGNDKFCNLNKTLKRLIRFVFTV